MKRPLITSLLLLSAFMLQAQQTQKTYLTGRGSDDTVEWDFYCTAGRNSGKWTKIGLPSVWECQGFGQYTYGHMPLKDRLDERGIYKRSFTVPASWKGQKVEVVFCGVMTDTQVKINGKSAGEIHQGGHYEFRYDVSGLLRYGSSNRIEVTVDKSSSNESLVKAERLADFWVFGGIFRPVYLEAKPSTCIEHFSIDAGADGNIRVLAELGGRTEGCTLTAQIKSLDGKNIGTPFSSDCGGEAVACLASAIEGVALWTAETPNLYLLDLTLSQRGRVLHHETGRFGFRTVEVRPSDGIYLNGTRLKIRGVNRHSFWPTTGRTLNDRINLEDALLIKEMNMNAVRCSHYPCDTRFLEICDSLGLYVIDELTGWQDAVDTLVGRKLVREMVRRDVNHPSIILWANGNEGGFNFALKPDYGKWDIQKRQVIHPWLEDEIFNTFHYPYWSSVKTYLAGGRKIWMPTEFNHGLYDGGHGAGLEDLWKIMQSNPLCAGGFLWDLVDQGLVRGDLGGKLDTDADHGADGIMGPYREKEGSFYAIKDIWSPIQLEGPSFVPASFDGRIVVENRYSFTNLDKCRFSASLKRLDFLNGSTETKDLKCSVCQAAPGLKGVLTIDMPGDFIEYDALEISALGPDGKQVCNWTRTITDAATYASRLLSKDKTGASALKASGFRFVNEAGEKSVLKVTELPSGWTEVEYEFNKKGNFDNVGVTFDFPEKDIVEVRWLGNGPYRVWENRLRGVKFGLWQKGWNDTATGESWVYPEFKGFHSNMYAADIVTKSGTLRIVFASDDLFLRLFTPAEQKVRGKLANTNAVFPDGQISVLNGISPVGTKFKKARETGPDSAKNYVEYTPIRNTRHATGRFYIKSMRGSAQ